MTYLRLFSALVCLSAKVASLSTPSYHRQGCVVTGTGSQLRSTTCSSGIVTERQETEPLLFWQQQQEPSSYYIYHSPQKKSTTPQNLWIEFCPSIWRPKERSVDVTIAWTAKDCPKQVAEEMIRQCTSTSSSSSLLAPDKASVLVQSLEDSLEAFRDFCQDRMTVCDHFKARIVFTRGPPGTKCPQWHIDHVPIRWIQSWAGPGCDFVTSQEGVNWSVINSLDDDDDDDDDDNYQFHSVEDRNRALVDSKVANICSVNEQDAILLVGNRWNEFAKETTDTPRKPVVHKSPSIPVWQGRVLLTQDVLLD
jgi:hypothetical protein